MRPIFLHAGPDEATKLVAARLCAVAAVHGITAIVVPPKPENFDGDEVDHIYLGCARRKTRRTARDLLERSGFDLLRLDEKCPSRSARVDALRRSE